MHQIDTKIFKKFKASKFLTVLMQFLYNFQKISWNRSFKKFKGESTSYVVPSLTRMLHRFPPKPLKNDSTWVIEFKHLHVFKQQMCTFRVVLESECAHGQLAYQKKAMKLCILAITGGNVAGYYYRSLKVSLICQKNERRMKDQALKNKRSVWQVATFVVTEGTKEQHKHG